MTLGLLNQIMKENSIPDDAELMSDSGRGCSETPMNGIFYNEDINTIVFTQTGDKYDEYHDQKNWRWLHGITTKNT